MGGGFGNAIRSFPKSRTSRRSANQKNPQVISIIDRDKRAPLGLDATQIANALYEAYGPR